MTSKRFRMLGADSMLRGMRRLCTQPEWLEVCPTSPGAWYNEEADSMLQVLLTRRDCENVLTAPVIADVLHIFAGRDLGRQDLVRLLSLLISAKSSDASVRLSLPGDCILVRLSQHKGV